MDQTAAQIEPPRDRPFAGATHALGNVGFRIEGSGVLAECVREEFASAVATGTAVPEITFGFVPRLPEIGESVAVGSLRIADRAWRTPAGRLIYQAHVGEDARSGLLPVFEVFIERAVSRRRPVPDFVRRFADWNYLTPEETAAKDFIYDVFDFLTQIRHLRHGASYLHASGVEHEGRGIAFVAAGGTGKTTILLKLAAQGKFRYLSDDLALIDSRGQLIRSPKKLQLYAYNVAGQAELERMVLSGRTALDRLSWELRKRRSGLSGVRRRVSAEALLGAEAVATAAPLETVIYLQRETIDDFRAEPMPPEELARRCALMLLGEMEPYGTLSIAMSMSGRPDLLPSPGSFLSETEAVLRDRFRRIRPVLLRIPQKAGPDDLETCIVRLLDREGELATGS